MKLSRISAGIAIGGGLMLLVVGGTSLRLGQLNPAPNARATEDHKHSAAEDRSEAGHGDKEGDQGEGKVAMTAARIAAAEIETQKAGSGNLARRLALPAVIIPDRARVGRVPARVVGTVSELKKRLGDSVNKGEVVAVLDSREVADAKSEYIAARVNFDLQGTLYEREKTLWEKQVTAEQRLLRARATQQEAQVRRDLARQKLSALGVSDKEIDALSADAKGAALERYEIVAPIGGRIVEQLVDLGTPVGGEGQAKELYATADLSVVWAELTVSTSDLAQIKEGQSIVVLNSASNQRSKGTIIFSSPMLDQDTRSARVVASVDNQNGAWRPGSFVTAEVAVDQRRVNIAVPKSSLQTINNAPNVFVRTKEGFEPRPVTLGSDDGEFVEIISGLSPGEDVAVANTFLLKAEAGKSEAGHAH